MKPAELGLPRRDLIASDAVTLERQRIRDRALDERYFHVEIEPGQGVAPAAIVPDAATFSFNFEDWPPGAATNRRRNVRRLELWPKTLIRLHLWYTSPVGSTNAFTIGFRLRQLDAGLSLAAAAAAPILVTNPSFSFPGPAVANDVLYGTGTTTVSVLPSPRVCGVTLTRIAPDANANDFRFILADFEFREVA